MESSETSRHELNLALLAPGEIFGGAERQMLALCLWLMHQDIRPSVILFRDTTLAAMLRQCDIRPTILPTSGSFTPLAVRHLRTFLINSKINVLHFHGYKAAVYTWLAAQGMRHMGKVKTEHGAIETPNSTFRERSKIALYRHLDAFATRRIHPEIVYVTHELKQHFLQVHRDLDHAVIYNGIDLPASQSLPRPADYHAIKKNIVILGRLEQVKGIEYALKALCHPAISSDVLFHIVGDGPLRESLEQLTKDLSLEDKVFFHGFRSNATHYLASADALLIPSMHEGLPYVLLEAMSLQVPVIVSAVGGMKEVLSDGATGLLVPPADPPAIANAIRRLMQSPVLQQQLRINAANLVSRRFSAATMGNEYLALYHRVLAKCSC